MERVFGNEVLDHFRDIVVLHRVNDGAPLLLEHESEKQIGVALSPWRCDANELRGESCNHPLAENFWCQQPQADWVACRS